MIINIPQLTEERRTALVKQAKAAGEHGKVSIRNARKETNDSLKQLQKDGLAEDAVKRGEDQVQQLTDSYVKKIDDMIHHKEGEIMTV